MSFGSEKAKLTMSPEVEKLFNSFGYQWEFKDDKIIINPEIWSQEVSTAIDKSKNVSYHVVKFLAKVGPNSQKISSLISSLFTPIKSRELVGALFNGISIIILAIILQHLFSFQFNVYNLAAIAISSASILYVIAAFIQSVSNALKPDQDIFTRRYDFSLVSGKYVIDYNEIIRQIINRKSKLVIISSILLLIFLLGLFTNYPLIKYLSEVFDLLGYLFALFFLLGQGFRGKLIKEAGRPANQGYMPFFIGAFFFLLFLVKIFTNSIILDYFFLVFEFPLYIYFFILSLLDVHRTKLEFRIYLSKKPTTEN